MKKVVLSLLCILSILAFLTGCSFSNKKYDKEFREYIRDNYGLQLNKKSEVNRCVENCDYYGFYTVGNDYNYAVQISKTGSSFEVTYDEDAIDKRATLYQYIRQIRGNDIAPNYLGFYKNTYSGHVKSSSIERQQLYYIVKYNDDMDLNTELKKDYEILQKAQKIIENSIIKEMMVVYIKDSRLNDEDWVLKLNTKVTESSDIIFDSEKYLNRYELKYRISNYNTDESLSSMSYTDFEKLVISKLEK